MLAIVNYFQDRKNLGFWFYICLVAGVVILSFFPETAFAVTDSGDEHLNTATTKMVDVVEKNIIPVAGVLGAVIGMWRSFFTGTITPLAVGVGAGVGGGMLITYMKASHTFII